MIKKLLDKLTSAAEEEQKIVLIDPAALGAGKPEPDLRIIGMFCDVHEEKVAEVIHAMLYLNEMNKLEKDSKERLPIEFYLSTYGGSADDMFSIYDMMNLVKETCEIHTNALGKVMSAGVLLLAAGTKGKRKIGANCRIMLHSCNAGNVGDIHNLQNEMEAISDLQDKFIAALVAETSLTKKQLKKLLDRKVNVYLTAQEAIEYGIVDEII